MYLPHRTDRHQACLIHISQKSGCYTVADKVDPGAGIPRWGGSASLCSGAGTVTAALRALQEESQSKLPALGYAVPCVVGNILLTAWGPVIVALMR